MSVCCCLHNKAETILIYYYVDRPTFVWFALSNLNPPCYAAGYNGFWTTFHSQLRSRLQSHLCCHIATTCIVKIHSNHLHFTLIEHHPQSSHSLLKKVHFGNERIVEFLRLWSCDLFQVDNNCQSCALSCMGVTNTTGIVLSVMYQNITLHVMHLHIYLFIFMVPMNLNEVHWWYWAVRKWVIASCNHCNHIA